jgi:hypothetical protein
MCCPRPTPAESFNLQGVYSICKLHQSRRTGKEFGAEVGENSKGKDIDTEAINNPC